MSHEPDASLQTLSAKMLKDAERLKAWIRNIFQGGCRVLSEGEACRCPLCTVDHLLASAALQEEAIRQLREACEELDQRRLTMEIHSDEVARQAQDDLALRKAAEAENQLLTAEIRSLRETRQENKDEKVTRVDGQS